MSGAAALLAILAGACFALSSVLQHRAARAEARHGIGDPRLLLGLVRRPLWLAGRLLAVAGVAVQALALRFGPLAAVQPLMVTGLLLSVPLEARLEHRRAQARDLWGVLLAGLGLVVFLIAASPGAGADRPSARDWVAVLAAAGGAVWLCVWAARAHPAAAGTWLGLATGVVYGLTAALLKAGVGSLADGPSALLTDWVLYAFVATVALGLVLSQNALQSGTLAAPFTAFTLSEPMTALAIGVAAFHESLEVAGGRLLLALLGLVAMGVGVRALTGQAAADPAGGAVGPRPHPAG